MRKQGAASATVVALPSRSGACEGGSARNRLAALAAAALFLGGPSAPAQSVPQNVTPQEYTARVEITWDAWIGLTPDGDADPDFETDSGISAEATMEYVLTFWNVGALKSGYGSATISRVYQPLNAITDIVTDADGNQTNVTIPMDLNRTAIEWAELSFSGGPDGTFSGTNPDTGKPLVGHVERQADGRWYGVFTEDIRQTYAITTLEPLGDWLRCEGGGDSGARFSNISRVVEIFPDSDPDAIYSAKPNSVLNVCDHVLTGEESSAIVTFPDLSTIMMRAEAEIVILSPRGRRPGSRCWAGGS